MVNHNLQTAMRSLQKRIDRHQAKIAQSPLSPLVVHWLSEIQVWQVWLRQLANRRINSVETQPGAQQDASNE
jgi:hypothetical protein